MKILLSQLSAQVAEMDSQIRRTLVQCQGRPSHAKDIVQRMQMTRDRLGLQEYAIDLMTFDTLLHQGATFPKKMCFYAGLLGAEMLDTHDELSSILDDANLHVGTVRVPKGKNCILSR